MAVLCQTMFVDACGELGRGVNEKRVMDVFVRAVNRAQSELAHRCDLDTFTPVTSIIGSVSIDEEYEYIIYAGVIFHMIRSGIRPSDPTLAAALYNDSKDRWDYCMGMYRVNEDNKDMDDADNDIAKFGSLTDTGDT